MPLKTNEEIMCVARISKKKESLVVGRERDIRGLRGEHSRDDSKESFVESGVAREVKIIHKCRPVRDVGERVRRPKLKSSEY